MAGSAQRTLGTLRAMCGEKFYQNLALCTTFWDEIDRAQGVQREEELLENPEFWKEMVDRGSNCYRLDGRKMACMEVLKAILKHQPSPLLLNEELASPGSRFENTAAARSTNIENTETIKKMYEEMLARAREETELLLKRQKEHHEHELQVQKLRMEMTFKTEIDTLKLEKEMGQLRLESITSIHKEKEKAFQQMQSETRRNLTDEQTRYDKVASSRQHELRELKSSREEAEKKIEIMKRELQEQDATWKKKLKNQEAAGRFKTANANTNFVRYQIKLLEKLRAKTEFTISVDTRTYPALLTTCDSCGNRLAAGTYYCKWATFSCHYI
ncbi:hypothetical protein ABW20_dc0108287 [Dactylellina cionopaga]|nr:hypothetical protein ABW20_dc0108287 [Dactylellina cionopaga]